MLMGIIEGDVVGLGLDQTTSTLFFTKNGVLVGSKTFPTLPSCGPPPPPSSSPMPFASQRNPVITKSTDTLLYPAVGLRSQGESVAVNLCGPFRYDIEAHVREVKERMSKEVEEVELKKVASVVDLVDDRDVAVADAEQARETEGKCEDRREGEMKEPIDSSHVGTPIHRISSATTPMSTSAPEPLPSNSQKRPPCAPLDPLCLTTTAFVLDYLNHHGHTKAEGMMRRAIRGRNWIGAPASSSSSSSSPTATDSRILNLATSDDIRMTKPNQTLQDFPTISSALLYLSNLIRKPFEERVPWTLWKELAHLDNASAHSREDMEEREKGKGKGKERALESGIRDLRHKADETDGMEREEMELEGSLLVYDFLHAAIFSAADQDSIEVDGEEGMKEEQQGADADARTIAIGRKIQEHLQRSCTSLPASTLPAVLKSRRQEDDWAIYAKEAFGAIVDPQRYSESERWAHWRDRLAGRLEVFLRREFSSWYLDAFGTRKMVSCVDNLVPIFFLPWTGRRNLPQISRLETAIIQTDAVVHALAERRPNSGAAFVDVKGALRLSEAKEKRM